jgi:hypothetical protein
LVKPEGHFQTLHNQSGTVVDMERYRLSLWGSTVPTFRGQSPDCFGVHP